MIGLRKTHLRSLAGALAITLAAEATLAYDHTPANSAALTNVLTGATSPALQFGDTITLQAGTTFTAPSGGFVLPNKTGTGWITIRSSALSSLPADGTRVDLGDAGNMPKILPNNFSEPAIKTATSAHHFKLVGLEVIGVQNGTTLSTGDLIMLGTSGTAQDTLTEVPGNFEIDRCIVRAASDTHRIKRGVALNSSSTDINDSYFANFKDPSSDTQAICGWNGPGPYNIINNYLEAACENIMFGGSVPSVPNLVPSNIVIQKNHFFKPISWNQHQPGTYSGNNWSIKNLFEIKNGANVLLEGNIFENHWVDSQAGWAIVLTPATDPGQAAWTVVEDVTFRNNIFRHMAAGPNILAYDASGDTSQQTNNIIFENNLFYDVGGSAWGGNGKLFQTIGGLDQIIINHNTAFQTSNTLSASGGQSTGCEFTNNMFVHGQYGFFGNGVGTGNPCFNNFFNGTTGVVFQKNVLMDNSSYSLNQLLTLYNQYPGGWNPTSLAFPQSWTGVLVDQANPGTDHAGYKVDPTSAYVNAGTDGADIGCDIDDVNDATAGCISGVWGTTTKVLKNEVNGYTGATSFHVSGQAPTTHYGLSTYQHVLNHLGGTNSWMFRPFYKFDLTQGAHAIPAGATIDSATLKVRVTYSTASTDRSVRIHRVAPVGGAFTMNYATATRNSPTGSATNWTVVNSAGSDVANSSNDFLDTPDSSATLPAAGETDGDMVFDVTSSVQAWVNGTPNQGWLLITGSTSALTVYLGATDDTNGPVDHPELTITYH